MRRALLLQGAAEPQVSTVSYGEERPAAAGSDEAAWAKNRRVEIVYLQKGRCLRNGGVPCEQLGAVVLVSRLVSGCAVARRTTGERSS